MKTSTILIFLTILCASSLQAITNCNLFYKSQKKDFEFFYTIFTKDAQISSSYIGDGIFLTADHGFRTPDNPQNSKIILRDVYGKKLAIEASDYKVIGFNEGELVYNKDSNISAKPLDIVAIKLSDRYREIYDGFKKINLRQDFNVLARENEATDIIALGSGLDSTKDHISDYVQYGSMYLVNKQSNPSLFSQPTMNEGGDMYIKSFYRKDITSISSTELGDSGGPLVQMIKDKNGILKLWQIGVISSGTTIDGQIPFVINKFVNLSSREAKEYLDRL